MIGGYWHSEDTQGYGAISSSKQLANRISVKPAGATMTVHACSSLLFPGWSRIAWIGAEIFRNSSVEMIVKLVKNKKHNQLQRQGKPKDRYLG